MIEEKLFRATYFHFMKTYFLIAIVIACSCNAQKQTTGELPVFIKEKIEKFKTETVTNPPRSIYSYTYMDTKVYFFPAPCCDRMSELYDASGNLLCNPDGGITGKGDGRCKDFFTTRTNEQLVWKDERK